MSAAEEELNIDYIDAVCNKLQPGDSDSKDPAAQNITNESVTEYFESNLSVSEKKSVIVK